MAAMKDRGMIVSQPNTKNREITSTWVSKAIKNLLAKGESNFDEFDSEDHIYYVTASDYAQAFAVTYADSGDKQETIHELCKGILEEFFVTFRDGDHVNAADVASFLSALDFKVNEVLRLAGVDTQVDFMNYTREFHPQLRQMIRFCETEPEATLSLCIKEDGQAIKNELKRLGIISQKGDLTEIPKEQAKQYIEYKTDDIRTSLLASNIRKHLRGGEK